MQSTGYFCHILKKLEFSTHISEKYANIKFHENPSSGYRVVRQKGRHDEANSRISQFYECVYKNLKFRTN